jgi:hypothetical protein
VFRAVLIESPFFSFRLFPNTTRYYSCEDDDIFSFHHYRTHHSPQSRSLTYTMFKAPPHKSLLLALLWELLLISVLIQFPYVRETFGITKPSLSDLKLIIAFSIVIFVIIKVSKLALRRFWRRRKNRCSRSIVVSGLRCITLVSCTLRLGMPNSIFKSCGQKPKNRYNEHVFYYNITRRVTSNITRRVTSTINLCMM